MYKCLFYLVIILLLCLFEAYLVHQRDASVSSQVEALKQCISVLFMYQRKPAKDDVFVKDTRLWLTRLVVFLLTILFEI